LFYAFGLEIGFADVAYFAVGANEEFALMLDGKKGIGYRCCGGLSGVRFVCDGHGSRVFGDACEFFPLFESDVRVIFKDSTDILF
jgi:hypothetical protein